MMNTTCGSDTYSDNIHQNNALCAQFNALNKTIGRGILNSIPDAQTRLTIRNGSSSRGIDEGEELLQFYKLHSDTVLTSEEENTKKIELLGNFDRVRAIQPPGDEVPDEAGYVPISDFDTLLDNDGKKGEPAGEVILRFIKAVLSREGMYLLMQNVAFDYITEKMMARVIFQSVKMLTAKAISSSLGTALIGNTISKAAGSAAYVIGTTTNFAAKASLQLAGRAVSAFASVFMVLQILTAIIDIWNPCEMAKPMDNESIKSIVKQLDTQVRLIVLRNFSTTTDYNGNKIMDDTWPVEYTADSIIASTNSEIPHPDILAEYKLESGTWDDVYIVIFAQYLQSLSFNSIGLPIYTGSDVMSIANMPRTDDPRPPESKLELFADGIANHNDEVAAWVVGNWIPLLVICAFMLFFIIIIIFK